MLSLLLLLALPGFAPVETQLHLVQSSPSLTARNNCPVVPSEMPLAAEKRIGIYGILCRKTNKWYIGQSYNLHERKRYHFCRLINRRHHNAHLQSAFDEHGLLWFEFIIIEECTAAFCDDRERFWIAHYRSADREFGYNKDQGGRAYKVVSEETRRRLSAANRKPVSPLHLAAIRIAAEKRRGKPSTRVGYRHSAEARRKMSTAKLGKPAHNKGKPMSLEACRKMSIAHAGKPRPWRVGVKLKRR